MTRTEPEPFIFDFFAALERRAVAAPETVALQYISAGQRETYSWRRLVEEIRSLSSLLLREGVKPGERVAILMENHPRWCVAFLAVQSAGGIAVPLETLSAAPSLSALADHSEAIWLIASPQLSDKARAIPAHSPGLQRVFADETEWEAAMSQPCAEALPHVPRTLDDDLAILYTGGTTGRPKGVLLSQRNLYRSVADMLQVFPLSTHDRVLSVLPLFHIMPLLANLLAPLYCGSQVTFLAQMDATAIVNTFREQGITAFLCVPQFYYLLQRRILEEVERQPRLKRWMFRRMLGVCGQLRDRFGMRLGKRLFRAVHAPFGGQLRAFGVGGAGFNPAAARFFADLGFQLFQAYGLTECSGLATATPLDRRGGFTCGKPVAHTTVRVVDCDSSGTGEIVIGGENLMRGYWRDPEGTRAAVRDGWLHTGDLGTLTPEGALRITGRAKEVIVLSSGKNVFPEEVEEFFRAHSRLIQELCVAGVDGPDGAALHCLVVPNLQAFRDEQSSFIEGRIRAEIETLARRLPSYKRPVGLHILQQPLPRTPTRKLQRLKAAELARAAASGAASLPAVESPTADPIEREMIALINRVHKTTGTIGLASSLELDVRLDSLERVELLANIERTFGISVTDQQSATLFTVGDLVNLVQSASPAKEQANESWRDWKSILLEPLTQAERDFTSHYLRRRFFAEAFWFAVSRAIRFTAFVLLRFRVARAPDLPAGGFLLCPNHISYLDNALVMCALPFAICRRAFFLGASKYFRNPALAWLGRNLRIVPVDADRHLLQALRMGRAGIEEGMILCVFPEGTRSFDGKLQKLMKGPTVLAEALGAPVVPIGVSGTFEVMPRGGGFGGLHRVGISVGTPIASGAFEDADMLNLELKRRLSEEIRHAEELRA